MANWANPTLTSSYTNFVTEVKDRDTDVAVWFEGITPTNTPTNAKRLNTSTGRFEKWNGTAWVDAVATFTFPALSVAGAATVTGALTINGGIANNPTLTAGTANGVAYLDGSKVLTTGSALTFNGTTLATTGTISADGELQNSGGRLAMYRAAGASYIDWASGQSLIWRTVTSMGGAGAATQMALTSTGLGIGTSSPTRRVTVGGTANALMDFNATSYRRYSIGSDANGFIVFDDTAGAYRLTEDASGNLGLAVTPSAWGSEHAAFQLGFSGAIQSYKAGTTAEYLSVISNAYNDNANWRYIRDGAATRYELFEGAHRWFSSASGTAGNAITFTQAMTLDSSGNLQVGTTSAGFGGILTPKVNVDATGGNGIAVKISQNDGPFAVALWNSAASGTRRLVGFYSNSSITGVGSITSDGSSTAYNTSSDYRLKHDIAPMTGALAKVQALKPVTYKWNADGSAGEGFIAHELAEVCPQAVTGSKDAVDEDGNPVYQGIDTSFLVATLTAAIQEQQAMIQQLQADVAALKGA